MTFFEDLKTRLDAVHTWPSSYQFKFVIPEKQKPQLMAIIPTGLIQEKWSRNRNYVSVTVKTRMQSSDEVITIYERAAQIEGIISL